MNQYKVRFEVSIYNGLGYHIRNEFRYKIIQSDSIENAKNDFKNLNKNIEIYDIE